MDPSSILTLTYTNAAMQDMALRFENMFGSDYSGKIKFSTISSLCYGITRLFTGKMEEGVFTWADGKNVNIYFDGKSEKRFLISVLYEKG